MNDAAVVFRSHDTFCYPLDKDRMLVTIRTGKEIDRVVLNWEEPYVSEWLVDKWIWYGEDKEADDCVDCETYLLWKFVVVPPFKRLGYIFKLYEGDEMTLFMESGFYQPEDRHITEERFEYFSYPWMNEQDVAVTPDWVPGTRWYQIFPDSFAIGDQELPKTGLIPWDQVYGHVNDHHGGDLKGIIQKLDYVKSLGVNGIYLNPIFVSPSYHRYNTSDYYAIDPELGTEEDYVKLCEEVHKRGMRIMIDAVFNHCGAGFAPWIDAAEKGPESKYFKWFFINQWPFDRKAIGTEDGKFYSFSFTSGMPKYDTGNPEVVDYLVGAIEKWARLGADGIRIDVSNETTHGFLRTVRNRLKALNPDFFILGENWQDSVKWLRGDELDSVMNYSLCFTAWRFLTLPEMTAKRFAGELTRCFNMYQVQFNRCMFNLIDSHDTERIFSIAGKRQDTFRQALVLQYTMPGSTCSYYGTELMLAADHKEASRNGMPWELVENGSCEDRIAFFRSVNALRAQHPVILSDGIRFLPAVEGDGLRTLRYRRFAQFDQKVCGGSDEVLEICINASAAPCAMPTGKVLLSEKCDNDCVLSGGFAVVRC